MSFVTILTKTRGQDGLYESLQISFNSVQEVKIAPVDGNLVVACFIYLVIDDCLGNPVLITMALKSAPLLADQPVQPIASEAKGRQTSVFNLIVQIKTSDISRFIETLKHRKLVCGPLLTLCRSF